MTAPRTARSRLIKRVLSSVAEDEHPDIIEDLDELMDAIEAEAAAADVGSAVAMALDAVNDMAEALHHDPRTPRDGEGVLAVTALDAIRERLDADPRERTGHVTREDVEKLLRVAEAAQALADAQGGDYFDPTWQVFPAVHAEALRDALAALSEDTPMTEPRTEAGRAHVAKWAPAALHNAIIEDVLAIEAEAAAPLREAAWAIATRLETEFVPCPLGCDGPQDPPCEAHRASGVLRDALDAEDTP